MRAGGAPILYYEVEVDKPSLHYIQVDPENTAPGWPWFVISDRERGDTYGFRVRAVSDEGPSEWCARDMST